MIKKISLSFSAGALLALSFPPVEWSYLAFVGLIPLLVAVKGANGPKCFLLGWLAGLTYFTGVVWWVTRAVINYGYLPAPVGWAVVLLMTAYLAIYPGVFAVAAGWAHERNITGLATVFFLPAVWTALEWIRGNFFFLAFPWANLAYTQYLHLPFIQSASLTGPYGPGFMIVAVNAAILSLWGFSRKKSGRCCFEAAGFMMILALVLANWAWGHSRLRSDTKKGEQIRIAVLQGNIPQDIKWDRAYREETIANYEELITEAAEQGAQLIVWPEAAAPFYFQTEAALRKRLVDATRKSGLPMLFGSPAFEVIERKIHKRNRAYYLDGQGNLESHYDKIHLVPFGEYVPFGNILTFAGKLVREVGDFTPGNEYRLFDLQEWKFGTVICYEIIFPGLVRRFAGAGASFMTNITNDAWYGRTSASHQHFTQMVFRAVENHLPIARAANTGISGFVDSQGRILFASGLFERGSYSRDLYPKGRRTFYTRYGDVFALLCLVIFAGWIILRLTDRFGLTRGSLRNDDTSSHDGESRRLA